MATHRAAIVYNPIRVTGKRLDRALEREETRAGWARSVRIPTRPGESTAELRDRILAEPVDVVVAAGGDGTVQAVAEAIVAENLPMAIWPVGSTNLLARNLGLGVQAPTAGLRAAFGPDERLIDAGSVSYRLSDGTELQRTFLVLAGIGVDAQMVVHTSDRAKTQLRWLAYVRGLARGLFTRHRFSAKFRLDDEAWQRGRLHTFAVANGGALPAGLRFLPDARVDDGELDLLILRPSRMRDWWQLAHWFARENAPTRVLSRSDREGMRTSNRADPASMLRGRVRAVRLRLEQGQDFEIDGEYLGKVIELHAEVQTGVLRVRVPVA